MSLGFYSFDEAKLQKVSILRKLFLKLFEIKKGEEGSSSFPLLIMKEVHSSDAPKIHQLLQARNPYKPIHRNAELIPTAVKQRLHIVHALYLLSDDIKARHRDSVEGSRLHDLRNRIP